MIGFAVCSSAHAAVSFRSGFDEASLAAISTTASSSASSSAPSSSATPPKLDRAPNTEELLPLAQFPEAAGCGEALAALLSTPRRASLPLGELRQLRSSGQLRSS